MQGTATPVTYGYFSGNVFSNETGNSTPLNATTEDRYWDIPTSSVLAVLLVLIIILSVVGNVLVIVVVTRSKDMFTRTNMFLCNLAVADLLTGIILMPPSLATIIAGKWVLGNVLCQLTGFATGFFFVTSIHTLMYIAVHKYLSITRPLSYIITKKKVIIMLAATWILATLAGYIRVHGLGTVVDKPYTTQCAPKIPHDVRTYMSVLFMAVFAYLLPFTVMLFCYIRIFSEIKNYSARLSECTNQNEAEIYRQQRRSTCTLCIVLVAFLLCFTPYMTYVVYISIVKDKSTIPKVLNPVVYWFGYLNSAVNPVIYGLRISGFRRGYFDMVQRMQCINTQQIGLSESICRRRYAHVNGTVTAQTRPNPDKPSPSTGLLPTVALDVSTVHLDRIVR